MIWVVKNPQGEAVGASAQGRGEAITDALHASNIDAVQGYALLRFPGSKECDGFTVVEVGIATTVVTTTTTDGHAESHAVHDEGINPQTYGLDPRD